MVDEHGHDPITEFFMPLAFATFFYEKYAPEWLKSSRFVYFVGYIVLPALFASLIMLVLRSSERRR